MIDPPRGSGPEGLRKLFRTALLVIPIGVLGNIAFSLLTTDRDLLGALGQFPRRYLLLALALTLVPWATNTLRLLIWTRFLGYHLPVRDAFKTTLVVDLGSAVSPTAVGGGIFKWGMLVQRGIRPGAAASITTFPIIEDGIFFAIAVPASLLLTRSWDLPVLEQATGGLRERAPLVLLGAAAVALLTWLAVRAALGGGLGSGARRRGLRTSARLRRRLRTGWRDAREVYRLMVAGGKWRFAVSLALTAIQWGARYSVISALVAFLGAPVRPVLFWALQWIVFTIMSFIPTPGATGGAEAAFFLVYSPFLPGRIIGLATAGWRFLTFYLTLAIAAVLFALLDAADRRRSVARTG